MYKIITLIILVSFNCIANTFEQLDFDVNNTSFSDYSKLFELQKTSKNLLGGAGQISGILTDKDTGEPIANEALLHINLIYRTDEDDSWHYVTGLTIEDSTYQFNDLIAGQYIISVSNTSVEINQEARPLYMPTLWNENFEVIYSTYNLTEESIIVLAEDSSLENKNFKLTPAALLFITDNDNKGEGLSSISSMNNEGKILFHQVVPIYNSVGVNGVVETTKIIFTFFPAGGHSFYIQSSTERYHTQNYVDYLYGEGDCYACQLQLIEGKGDKVNFLKHEKIIININRSKGASISGKLTFEKSQFDEQFYSLIYLQPVHVYGDFFSSRLEVVRDELSPNGEYYLSGIAAGEYTLYFKRKGFFREFYKNHKCPYGCDYFESYPIRVNEGENLVDIDVHLKKGSRFHGLIVDSETNQSLFVDNNNPNYYPVIEILNEDLSLAAVADFTSDWAVAYISRYALSEGNYYIKTGVSTDNYSNDNYINQVYPNIECEGNICDFSQAQLVHLTGDMSDGINFSLNRAKFISGKVIDSSNKQALSKLSVVVLNQQGYFVNSGKTDMDGNYRIGGLKSGSYFVRTYNGNKKLFLNDIQTANTQSSWINKLYPNRICENNNCPFDSADLIQITDSDSENINISLDKGYSITGKVTNSIRNIGVQDVEIKIHSETGEYIESYFSDEHGYYASAALKPGIYKLFTTNDRHYVNQNYGGNDCGLNECNPANSVGVTIENNQMDDINFNLLPGSDYYPRLSGLWYNPDQSGHGFQVEVIKSNGTSTLLVSWYAMLDGQPIWLLGTGPLNKDIAFVDLIITNGTNFPPQFAANDVQRINWGLLKFNFTDENNAMVSWETEVDGFNNGSMEIQRLTTLSQAINQTGDIDACLSGTFYNQDQSGHGVMLEVLGESNDSMVLTWYVYNETEQFWLLANGQFQGDSATMSAHYTSGSTFPPDFVATDVQQNAWGDLKLGKINNDTIKLSWMPNSANQSFGTGSMEMQRLTHIEGMNCQ